MRIVRVPYAMKGEPTLTRLLQQNKHSHTPVYLLCSAHPSRDPPHIRSLELALGAAHAIRCGREVRPDPQRRGAARTSPSSRDRLRGTRGGASKQKKWQYKGGKRANIQTTHWLPSHTPTQRLARCRAHLSSPRPRRPPARKLDEKPNLALGALGARVVTTPSSLLPSKVPPVRAMSCEVKLLKWVSVNKGYYHVRLQYIHTNKVRTKI